MTHSDALALVIAVLAAGHLAAGNWAGNAMAVLALVVLLLNRPRDRKPGPDLPLQPGGKFRDEHGTVWTLVETQQVHQPGHLSRLIVHLTNDPARPTQPKES